MQACRPINFMKILRARAIAIGTYLAIIATGRLYLAAQNNLAMPDLANFPKNALYLGFLISNAIALVTRFVMWCS
jgi:hypothetical protein